MLQGKGVWAWRLPELARALEIAPQMGATHVVFKVGRAVTYYSGMAEVAGRIRTAGLVPLAYTYPLLEDPQAESRVVVNAFGDGFEGVILNVEADACRRRYGQATALGQYLDVAGVDPQKLFNCSYPSISYHSDLPYEQLNTVCQGGLMPMAYGTFFAPGSTVPPEEQARRTIDEWTYGHYAYWASRWGCRPPLYPVLGPYHDQQGTVRMGPAEFQLWLDRLAAHGPSFFSVFTAAVIEDDLLPLLRACPLGRPETGIRVQVESPEVGYLNLRATPSIQFPPIGRLDHGALIDALDAQDVVQTRVGQDGQWLRVRAAEGIEGFVAAWYLRWPETVAPPLAAGLELQVVSPAVGYLNVRPEPSIARDPLTRVDDGDVLQALEPDADVRARAGQAGAWLHVRTAEGIEGYVSAGYVRLREALLHEVFSHLVVKSSVGLNVRPQPGTDLAPCWHVGDQTVLQSLEDGAAVEGKVGRDRWIRVCSPSLHEGFVNGLYVAAQDQLDERRPVTREEVPAGECPWIFGLHAADSGASAEVDFLFHDKNKTGWVLFTEAIHIDPHGSGGYDYRRWCDAGYGVIVRLNHDYAPGGTLPVQAKYDEFAETCARYVRNSAGCRIWIVGNEPNNPVEHPGGPDAPHEHITPLCFAEAFNRARRAIKQAQPEAVVVPGAIDPYFGLPWKLTGETHRPLDYFREALAHIEDLDGIALHTYTHGLNVSRITARTVFGNAPLDPHTPHEHYYDFQAYRAFAEAIPARWRDRPIYITESNHWIKSTEPDGAENGWLDRDVGWVQAAYAEIDRWNQTPYAQQIHCLLLYRWTGDKWEMRSLGQVHGDLRKALDHDYRWRR